MGKFIVVIVILLITGLFFYFKPEQTKETFKDVKDSIVDGISNWLNNREVNLGKPTLPCVSDDDCNSNIEKCESKCRCFGGNCIKNVPVNSS